MEPWTFGIFEKGINAQGIGSVGMLLNFFLTLALTPFCPEPRKDVKDLVDSVREPEGEALGAEFESTPKH